MRTVSSYHGCTILLAIVKRDLNLPRVGDHVIIREHVAIFIDDEARALPFLRNQAVKKVERHGFRSYVHHRADIFVVNGNIILLVRVERVVAGSFSNFDLCRWRVDGAESAGPISGEVKEYTH